MPVRRLESNKEFSSECSPLCDEELKVVLMCMGTTWNISCSYHAHIPAGTGFRTHLGDSFAHLIEYCIPWELVTLA
jgi:hypothetical protein